MNKGSIWFIFLILFGLTSCKQNKNEEIKHANNTPEIKNYETAPPQAPDIVFGELFKEVQMKKVFPDGKTFADCTAKTSAAEIMKAYAAEKSKPGFDLRQFVARYFTPPVPAGSGFKTNPAHSAAEHINALWPILTRAADANTPNGSTLLPLPHPYVVPGGRFGEVYYWDSYFTMLGLESAGQKNLIENMVKNFAFLIDQYGHIPNGNRSYYLSRSQPPFFSLMVGLLQEASEPGGEPNPIHPAGKVSASFLAQMEKEYQFWMQPDKRSIKLPSGEVLNRYWDDHAAPRPESYREDVETAEMAVGRDKTEVYRHLKAGAESGWDFSSRWFQETNKIATIQTTDIIPVDLNCLIWHLETFLSAHYKLSGNLQKTEYYAQLAEKRKKSILELCWDAQAGWFFDYNWKTGQRTGKLALSGIYPLFFGIATQDQASTCAKTLEKNFLRPGGLVTTPFKTGQQWDAPNGWAPLQWVSIAGLRKYGQTALANTIKERWVDLNEKVFKNTGKMLEKYNVEDLSLTAGGGEYPVQDGFGWTNGVLLRLLLEK